MFSAISILLFIGGALLLSVLVAWLTATIAIFLIRRKYSHIPSPRSNDFYILGHLSYALKSTNGSMKKTSDIFLDWYLEAGPVLVWFALFKVFVMTFNPDDIKELCMTPSVRKDKSFNDVVKHVFGQRFLGNSLSTVPDYESWRPHRKLYDPCFKKSVLKQLVPVFNECTSHFIQSLRPLADGKTQIDVKKRLSVLTLNIISKAAFGEDFTEEGSSMCSDFDVEHMKDNEILSYLVAHSMEGSMKKFGNPFFQFLHPWKAKGYRKAIRVVRAIGKKCIEKRIQKIKNGEQTPNDILSRVLRIATAGEENDIEDLVDDFTTFYIAGQDTTSSLLQFTLVMLHQHPDVKHRVLSELAEVLEDRECVAEEDLDKLEYMEQVLKETLRLYHPVAIISKEAPSGLKLSGYSIPQKTTILLSSALSSVLPENFEDPMVFNPTRFAGRNPNPFVFFPFGAGHRACIGRMFAMMEAKVILSQMLRSFSIALPDDFQLKTVTRLTLQATTLPCTLTPVWC